jgi:hypothetical protein
VQQDAAIYMMFKKELYTGIPIATVLRKRLHLKTYKLSIVQGVERWIAFMPLSVNVGSIWNAIVKLFLKHSSLTLKVTLDYNYPG